MWPSVISPKEKTSKEFIIKRSDNDRKLRFDSSIREGSDFLLVNKD